MNVYLDHAATTCLLPEVRREMLPYLSETFGNPDSLHSYGRKAAHAVTAARDRIASLLGADPFEVYFTSGGTEADNWGVRGMGRGKAVISPIEHAAVLASAPLREGGADMGTVGRDGIVRVSDLEGTMSGDCGLVCVMAVNNETGCIQPIAELAALAHSHGAYLFCDCVQAACSQDLKEIFRHADGIALSAHKMGGPKGTGVLAVRKGVPLRPLLVGGEQERELRGGTSNVAGIAGMAIALELAQERREEFCRHTASLREELEGALTSALGDRITVDGENRAPNLSHITFSEGGPELLTYLDLNGVACSGGAACSAHAQRASHVMTAMGRGEEEAKKGIRFSFGRETTMEEIGYAVSVLLAYHK